ncbi:HipA N-terminal domain-containing protein [Fulvivirgaceae bacterium BMA12]|uniref:HipA N-terminal domain-containing protein n=1 Tax=Agaribacillus aureus TaxID=3051825 RepID=A0ABT8LIT2_9BACT|nr:HipA N-terminal domain-containing protein [Fulvivirgaceae bacterium BMA12]
MLEIIKKWFSKSEEDLAMRLPKNEQAKFILTVDNIEIGFLRCKEGEWIFKYSEEFKEHIDKYKLIVGFPDVNKEYRSETLWPFFRIRIPGLKQPAVKEILEKESIDKENEAALLIRFGQKTIANPYELHQNI